MRSSDHLEPRALRGVALAMGIGLLISGLAAPELSAQTLNGFVRGDCNADGEQDISDAIGLLNYILSAGSSPECEEACDTNDDGNLDIADVIFGLNWLFGGGPPPEAPFPVCGFDLSDDALTCANPPCPLGSIVGERAFTAKTARAGLPYASDLPRFAVETVRTTLSPPAVIEPGVPFTAWGVPATSALPTGVFLDRAEGRLFGSPNTPGLHQFRAWALDALGGYHILHVDLASFSADDSEIIPGQDLTVPGPYSVTQLTDFYIHSHVLPWPLAYPLWFCNPSQPNPGVVNQGKQIRIFLPENLTGPAPLLLFHHGTGFSLIEYDEILGHLASYGVICASINDQYSYNTFPTLYCWGGHEEAARVMVSLREFLGMRADDPADELFGLVDGNRIFYGGHSRGGASAMVARELDPDVRGVVALQPTDAKQDSFIGNTDRWERLPDVPVLDISAEQDFDVIFPFAERLLERFTGPTTMVTIYGGCHGFTTDDNDNGCFTCQWTENAPAVDYCSYISREVQHRWTRQLCTAFLLRHGLGDLSVEGQLYGSEWSGSPYISHAARRELAGATWIDDFSGFPTNLVGGTWTGSGTGNASQGSCYDLPAQIPDPLAPIDNLIVSLQTSGTFELACDVGGSAGLDVAIHRDVVFRLKNHDRWQILDNFGFGWLDLTMRLTDTDGDSVELPLHPYLPDTTFHPETSSPVIAIRMKYQRYIDIRIPLAEFIATNPALELDSLAGIAWELTVSPSPQLNVAPRIGFDDLRFE